MIFDDPDIEDYILEGAAVTTAAILRNPLLFWLKFLEASWTTID